ncbi:MAG: M1 family aminopeptidase [Terriglobales bacterium]
MSADFISNSGRSIVTKVLPLGALILLVLAPVVARAQEPAPASAAAFYRQLSSPQLDPDRVFRVRDISVRVHEIEITFTDGVIAFTKPVNGEVTGAYFQGEGEALVRPPDLVERESLALFTGNAILEEKFTAGFFRFRGGEMADLAARLRVPVAAADFLARGQGVMQSLGAMDALALLDDALNRPQIKETGYFHGRVQGAHLGNFDINFDADQPEQITIGRVDQQSGKELYDIWTRFSSRSVAPAVEPVEISDYHIGSQLSPPTDLSADVKLQLQPRVAGVRCVIFELSRNLKIKAVTSGNAPLEFIQNESLEGTELARRGNDVAAVIFPTALPLGAKTELHFAYAGPVLADAGNGLIYVGARGTWYPNRGPAMANFDMWLEYPREWRLVASGEHIAGDFVLSKPTSHWKSEGPIPVAGFNIGRYQTVTSKTGNTSIEVYAARGIETLPPGVAADEKKKRVQPRGALAADPARNLNRVVQDAVRDVESLQRRLGPFPFHNLEITQMPGQISQGWPGLIYLSSYAFLSSGERPPSSAGSYEELLYDRLMLAHEIAHQWWGDAVLWAGPRDAWLIEALANYSALQSLEEKNPHDLRTALEFYQASLTRTNKDGKTLADAGPVTLGFRLSSSKFPTGYEEVAYGRGTWLIHMLREMMRDRRMQDPDARFHAALKQILEERRGKTMTNKDVQRIFEAHLPPEVKYEGHASLDWFFDGWVNGSAVPEFSIKSAKIVRRKNGVSTYVGTIVESGAPERLVTCVPIYAESPDPESPPTYLGSVFVDESEVQFSFPAPPGSGRPLLDPYRAVLRK